jgi:hypothetical protein
MNGLRKSCATNLAGLLAGVLALVAVQFAIAASSPTNESELQALGFKVLVATTPVQQQWVKQLTPGHMRPMQRNGKKYFIYPDAARNQIYVGGPQEYEAYLAKHPEDNAAAKQRAQQAADSAYRAKKTKEMQTATSRDLSNPFLGVTWSDLGW